MTGKRISTYFLLMMLVIAILATGYYILKKKETKPMQGTLVQWQGSQMAPAKPTGKGVA